MDLTGVLGRSQARAVSRMSDTCRITRSVASSGELDPVTGVPAAGARTVIYQGACRVRTGGTVSAGSQRESAGDVATQVQSVLHIPVGAPAARVDDLVEILTSVNPSLPAVVFTVSGMVPGSQMTAQRVQVTAVVG